MRSVPLRLRLVHSRLRVTCAYAPNGEIECHASRRPPFAFDAVSDKLKPVDMLEMESFHLCAAQSGVNIDKLIAEQFAGRSRTCILSLLSQSQMPLDGSFVRSNCLCV